MVGVFQFPMRERSLSRSEGLQVNRIPFNNSMASASSQILAQIARRNTAFWQFQIPLPAVSQQSKSAAIVPTRTVQASNGQPVKVEVLSIV